jgi:hypothetical protein
MITINWPQRPPIARFEEKGATAMNSHFANILTCASVLLAACGDAASEDADPKALDIAGHWISSCLAQADGTFARLDFQIGSTQWALAYTIHASSACDAPVAVVEIDGPYEIGAESPAVQGAFDARFGFEAKTITAHADAVAEALAAAGCGSGQWQLEQPQSVAEAGCAAFGQYPIADCSADYDLVAREGDTLRFGARPADNDLCTPEKRPSALSSVALERASGVSRAGG